jgi:NAD(P)-dependent dehydrogenase (short-subunit alcohol dehydrogenase family)
VFRKVARLEKGDVVSNKNIWFITGAGRGMGADFAKAALAAGHSVVAAGRDTDRVSKALGQSNDLLPVKLDVTSRADAEAAVRAAVDRFGRIDVLVNNAASFYAGFFEELTPEQFNRQLATSLIGPMNVTRAVLPVMRNQRSGHIISISSTAGLTAGYDFASAYAASKFGLEGWMESLQAEVAPFGINTTIVNPGFFRTELLTEQSTNYAEPSIADYDERRGPLVDYWKSQNGRQSGDPVKLARAHYRCRPEPAAPPLHRRCRCHCRRRAEDRRFEAADRSEPGAVDVARVPLGIGCDACGRTSVRIVRSVFQVCVRTV